jgi:hypothetical protein
MNKVVGDSTPSVSMVDGGKLGGVHDVAFSELALALASRGTADSSSAVAVKQIILRI